MSYIEFYSSGQQRPKIWLERFAFSKLINTFCMPKSTNIVTIQYNFMDICTEFYTNLRKSVKKGGKISVKHFHISLTESTLAKLVTTEETTVNKFYIE